jgi:hypothetical protein
VRNNHLVPVAAPTPVPATKFIPYLVASSRRIILGFIIKALAIAIPWIVKKKKMVELKRKELGNP